MRRIISIFFLFLFSVAFTEAGQFVKIGFVVQHYYSHQKDSGESVLGFLKNHYWSEHKNDGDDEQDNRLPFKNAILTSVGSVLDVPATVVFPNVVYSDNRVHNLYHAATDIFEPLNAIFHPPQSA